MNECARADIDDGGGRKNKGRKTDAENRAMTTRTQMNEAKVIAAGPGRRTMSGELVPLGAKRDARAR